MVRACVGGQDHRRPARDPALDRRLLPPLRVEAVEDARIDDAAVHVLGPGERAPFEQQHPPAGAGQHGRRARSGRAGADDDDVVVQLRLAMRSGVAPTPRRAASSSSTALASLTTARSASCIIGQCGSMLTLMTWSGVPEPGRVLHGAADAERQVQRGVDDDAGRADLALVADPAAVGDHPGGAHRGAERGGHAPASWRKRSAESSPAPPATMRVASARSIVVTSGGSTSTTVASTVAADRGFPRIRGSAADTVGAQTLGRLDAADAGLQRGHDRPVTAWSWSSSPPPRAS